MKQNYDEIRPYNDAEIPAAAQRVADSPYLPAIVNYLFPGKKVEEIQQLFRNFRSVYDFQTTIMYPAIHSIVDKTSNGLTSSGFDTLKDGRKRMFISNHRDILLDAAILQTLLFDNGIETTEITFGSNLMEGELVVDIGKMNTPCTFPPICATQSPKNNSPSGLPNATEEPKTATIRPIWRCSRCLP